MKKAIPRIVFVLILNFLALSVATFIFSKNPTQTNSTVTPAFVDNQLSPSASNVDNTTQQVIDTPQPDGLNSPVIENPPIEKPTPTIPPKPPAKLCLIQISGVTYDVTTLRRTHSGGDIFTCNTDMTTLFSNQHGLSRVNEYMSKYLYN